MIHIGHHQSGLVGLIAVPFHADPCYVASVRTPDRVGVIASAHRDDLAFSAPDIVDVYFRVCAESVLPARFLAAGIGDEPSVRAPVQLLDPAERLSRELIDFLLSCENVNAGLCGYRLVERGYECVRNLRNPMVPMPVHQVVCLVGCGLVQCRVRVGRCAYRTLDSAHEHYTASVRRELEFADAGRNVGNHCLLHQLGGIAAQTPDGGLPDLSLLDIHYAASAFSPSGAAYAAAFPCELSAAGSVRIDEEEVAAAAVVRYGCVADPVKNCLSVRRELWVGETAQRKHYLRRHLSVLDGDVGLPDVSGGLLVGAVGEISHCNGECCGQIQAFCCN